MYTKNLHVHLLFCRLNNTLTTSNVLFLWVLSHIREYNIYPFSATYTYFCTKYILTTLPVKQKGKHVSMPFRKAYDFTVKKIYLPFVVHLNKPPSSSLKQRIHSFKFTCYLIILIISVKFWLRSIVNQCMAIFNCNETIMHMSGKNKCNCIRLFFFNILL